MTNQPELEPSEPVGPADDTHQTQFTWEEPLFEETRGPAPIVAEPTVDLPKKPWYKKPLVLALGFFMIVMTLLVISMMMTPPPQEDVMAPEASAEPIVSLVSDPLKLKIVQLKAELRAADPTNQELPFPPVSKILQLAPLQ